MISLAEKLDVLLKDEIEILKKSRRQLNYALNLCSEVEVNQNMSEQELVNFDALGSRFVRVYEVYVFQVIRTILTLVDEYSYLLQDNWSKAEKSNIISDARLLNEARKLRNVLSHEYQKEEWIKIYKRLRNIVPKIIHSIEITFDFIEKRNLLRDQIPPNS